MKGLMQDWPLTVDRIIDYAATQHGHVEVVTRSVEGPIARQTYADLRRRAKQVSHLLLDWGIRSGDRVATLAWNTGRHMELWYGIVGIGAVCHTLNPRLPVDQLATIIGHAGDRLLFADKTFIPLLDSLVATHPGIVERIVLLDDGSARPAGSDGYAAYEEAIAGRPDDTVWGGFPEDTAAGLCYTSGTTGGAKGVLYSHRSNFLHTLMSIQPDIVGISATDTVLPIVPMFHANAWGVAFSGPAVGAKLVLPGARMDGASIHDLLESERVTLSAAVPTVWQMLLQHLDATGATLSSLKRVVIGGSATPDALIRAFQDRYGVEVRQGWGMTEMSPIGAISTPNARVAALPAEERMTFQLKQGRAPLCVELVVKDDEGEIVPRDGITSGRLMARGAAIAAAYFGSDAEVLDADGFFDTGDIATIDADGFMQITDRAKDLIKSGGEWISSMTIENAAADHPKTAVAAVIAVPHPKWDERPLLLVQLRPGEFADRDDYLDWLRERLPKWWMPDDVLFEDEIPIGPTGKIDKKPLRLRFTAQAVDTLQGRTS